MRPDATDPTEPSSAYSVGVVVLTFNKYESTRECLRSVEKVVHRPIEVVVVDNASSDGTADRIRDEFPDVTVLPRSVNSGYAGGNNAGIRWCLDRGHDAVMILNNDAVVTPGFMAPLVEHARTGAIAAPETRSLANPATLTSAIGFFDWNRGRIRAPLLGRSIEVTERSPLAVEFAGGSCLLVPKKVFLDVGLFAEEYFLYYEDADFLVRARNAGFRILYEPRSTIYHDQGAVRSGAPTPLALYYTTRNRLLFMARHSPRRSIFMVYFLVGRVAAILGFLLKGRVDLLTATINALFDFARRRFGPASRPWSNAIS